MQCIAPKQCSAVQYIAPQQCCAVQCIPLQQCCAVYCPAAVLCSAVHSPAMLITASPLAVLNNALHRLHACSPCCSSAVPCSASLAGSKVQLLCEVQQAAAIAGDAVHRTASIQILFVRGIILHYLMKPDAIFHFVKYDPYRHRCPLPIIFFPAFDMTNFCLSWK